MLSLKCTEKLLPIKKRQKSSDSLNTIQQTQEPLPIKKRRGCNRDIKQEPLKDITAVEPYYESTQTLAVALSELQKRYIKTQNELNRLKDLERARYQYDISLTFNKYFDPMNPDHMSWFRQFARQTMRHKPVLQIIDEEAEPEPDHYINNPFGIPIGLEERRNRPRTFYVLCAKITMDNLNIPLALEFYTHKCPK